MPSAEKSLKKSGKAITANDAGTALDAQKEFQERLSKALAAMGSAMAQNLQLEGSSEDSANGGILNDFLSPLTPPSLDSFSGMAFGSESSGSEIGDAILDALERRGSRNSKWFGEGEGQSSKGYESQLQQLACLSGVPSPPQAGGKPQGGSQKEKGKPGNPNSKDAFLPGKGGGSKAASWVRKSLCPTNEYAQAGAPGRGERDFDSDVRQKPHGTHFETTAIKEVVPRLAEVTRKPSSRGVTSLRLLVKRSSRITSAVFSC